MATIILHERGSIMQTIEQDVEEEFIGRMEALGNIVRSVPLEAILNVDLTKVYWPNDEAGIVLRPTLPAEVDHVEIIADFEDVATVSGLPVPCVVTIDDVPYDVADGTLTFRSDMPGDYEIGVRHWPHLDWKTTITVTKPAAVEEVE